MWPFPKGAMLTMGIICLMKTRTYLGTVSVPLQGKSVTIHNLRLEETVKGKISPTEGGDG